MQIRHAIKSIKVRYGSEQSEAIDAAADATEPIAIGAFGDPEVGFVLNAAAVRALEAEIAGLRSEKQAEIHKLKSELRAAVARRSPGCWDWANIHWKPAAE